MSGTFAPRLWVLCLTAAVALAAACPAQEAQEPPNPPDGFSPPIDVYDYEDLAERLRRAEAELARRALEPVPGLTGAELLSYESLHREIAASFYGELMDRSRFLVLLARAQALAAPAPAGGAPARIPRPDREKREERAKRAKPARILLGTAVASFGLSFSLWAVAERQDSLYFASPTIAEATFHRRLYQVCGLSSIVLAGVGALASGASVSLLLAGGP